MQLMTRKTNITAEFFKGNRKRLMDARPSSIFVFSGNREMQSSGDAAFGFRQESNFWWLTGIDKPDWWLIIDGVEQRSYLIAPESDATRAVFDGEISSGEVRQLSGVDDVLVEADAVRMLRELAAKHSVAYGLGADPHEAYYHFIKNPGPKDAWQRIERIFNSTQDSRKVLAKLRAVKQPEEVGAIKQAIAMTAAAFTDIKSQIETYMHEYQIDAEFTYQFRKGGCQGHAYDPIVAAGKNACTLHYGTNNDRLSKKQLVLLDVGARYDGYPADITRTYATSEPTKRQAQVHAAVQAAHYEIISLLEPGLAMEQYLQTVDSVMKRTLVSLGLMKNMTDEANYRRYFPHAISHGLGVDVHDSLGGFVDFKPGMILTVEPGIYIPEESIGVRIEDDILITVSGHENLSASLSTDY